MQYVNVNEDPLLEIVTTGDGDFNNQIRYLSWTEDGNAAEVRTLISLPEERQVLQITNVTSPRESPPSFIIISTGPRDETGNLDFFTEYYRPVDGAYEVIDRLVRASRDDLNLIRHWIEPGTNQIIACYNKSSVTCAESPRIREGYIKLFQLTWSQDKLEEQSLGQTEGITFDPTVKRVDLNGDNQPDLLLGVSQPTLVGIQTREQILWKSATQPDFEPINSAAATGRLLPAEDMDNDGLEDFVTSATARPFLSWKGTTILWKHNGDGTFTKKDITAPDEYREIIAVVDREFHRKEGDDPDAPPVHFPQGKKDFLVRTPRWWSEPSAFHIGLLAQAEDGEFHYIDLSYQTAPLPYQGKWPIEKEYLADWNNNGIDDLITFWSGGQALEMTVLPGPDFLSSWWNTRLNFVENVPNADALGIVQFPVIADYNDDSFLNIITRGNLLGSIANYAMINDGSGEIQRIERLSDEQAISFARQSKRIDLDGDSDRDLIYREIERRINGAVRLYWQENKNGTLSSGHTGSPISPTRFGERDQFTSLDINSDGTRDLIVFSSDNSRLEYFLISAPKPGPPEFQDWVLSEGITGHSSSPLMDYDRDSISNWEEFLFGTNPTVPDRNSPQRPGVRMTSTDPRFTYHLRSDFEPGLSHQTSHDLINWMPLERAPLIIPGDDAFQEIQFPLDPNRSREFFKTTIPLPPEN